MYKKKKTSDDDYQAKQKFLISQTFFVLLKSNVFKQLDDICVVRLDKHHPNNCC